MAPAPAPAPARRALLWATLPALAALLGLLWLRRRRRCPPLPPPPSPAPPRRPLAASCAASASDGGPARLPLQQQQQQRAEVPAASQHERSNSEAPAPTASPTASPTAPPTARPIEPSIEPSIAPPTARPIEPPTASPTAPPTAPPTARPIEPPTASLTAPPIEPSIAPPTASPTAPPTAPPTALSRAPPTAAAEPGDGRPRTPTQEHSAAAGAPSQAASAPAGPRAAQGVPPSVPQAPEPQPEAQSETRLESQPETQVEPQLETQLKSHPEPHREPQSESQLAPHPESHRERQLETQTEPQPETQPEPQPEPLPETRRESQLEPEPEPRRSMQCALTEGAPEEPAGAVSDEEAAEGAAEQPGPLADPGAESSSTRSGCEARAALHLSEEPPRSAEGVPQVPVEVEEKREGATEAEAQADDSALAEWRRELECPPDLPSDLVQEALSVFTPLSADASPPVPSTEEDAVSTSKGPAPSGEEAAEASSANASTERPSPDEPANSALGFPTQQEDARAGAAQQGAPRKGKKKGKKAGALHRPQEQEGATGAGAEEDALGAQEAQHLARAIEQLAGAAGAAAGAPGSPTGAAGAEPPATIAMEELRVDAGAEEEQAVAAAAAAAPSAAAAGVGAPKATAAAAAAVDACRDSANHSPAEGMLASPRACYSDAASEEDSSDSGKGCSDAPTPPSRTPASGSSVSGDGPAAPAAPQDADAAAGAGGAGGATGGARVYEFVLPQHLVGRLIGRHGCFVHQIKARTNASILIKRHPDTARLKICAVEGSPADVEGALEMIRQKFPEKRYPNVSLEQVCFVAPPLSVVPVLPDCLRLQLVEGISNDVIVSSLVTPAHFFLQQPTHPTFPALVRLGACMDATYGGDVDAPAVPTVQAGIVVAAPVMGSWYRAEVVAAEPDEETCQVRYVDYGGYEIQMKSSLRQIRSDFMTLPFQAAECYLANVICKDEAEGWSTEALAAVEQMTAGQVIQAQVYGYCEDGVPAVCLYSLLGPQVVSVGQELVARGLAQGWEPADG